MAVCRQRVDTLHVGLGYVGLACLLTRNVLTVFPHCSFTLHGARGDVTVTHAHCSVSGASRWSGSSWTRWEPWRGWLCCATEPDDHGRYTQPGPVSMATNWSYQFQATALTGLFPEIHFCTKGFSLVSGGCCCWCFFFSFFFFLSALCKLFAFCGFAFWHWLTRSFISDSVLDLSGTANLLWECQKLYFGLFCFESV